VRTGRFLSILTAMIILAPLTGGCVYRRLTIRSEPTGALVRLEDREVGRSPVTVAFDHYGLRTITLEHEGYLRLVRNVSVKPPWYEVFPLDFFTEVLWPGSIFVDRTVELKMERRRKYTEGDSMKLLERGKQMRQRMIREISADPLSAMSDEDPYWLDPKVPLREIK